MCGIRNKEKEAEQYFHCEIEKLIDKVYDPSKLDVAKLFVDVHSLRGALDYALAFKDIDFGYYRIFTDMLTGITGELLKK